MAGSTSEARGNLHECMESQQPIARLWNFRSRGARLGCRLTMPLNHATVSSMKRGATPELIIGACVLIALALIAIWLFDKDS